MDDFGASLARYRELVGQAAPGDGQFSPFEAALRADLAAPPPSVDDGTCADPYCTAECPPAPVTAYGWYQVGDVAYCPSHGYGPALKAKRKAAFEQRKAAVE